ncbi:MAG: transposase [Acidobacteriota bacterium]
MSLKPKSKKGIPKETVKVAKTSFPKGNIYIKIRDELGAIYEDEEFAALFSDTGRPAESPGRLALVTIFQFAESLSDRAAADAVRGRIDWKYALGLALDESGFDASVLTEFRARLVENNQAQIIFEKLIEKLKQVKLVKARGKQRTDSTIVLASIHAVSRLECVTEAMRFALNSISMIASQWLIKIAKHQWFERYEKRLEDFRFKEEERKK